MKNRAIKFIRQELSKPLWYAAFRPFFFLSAFFGIVVMVFWPFVFVYGFKILGQAENLSLTQWHSYNMLYGFVMAALAGFIVTAIPEFTNTSFLPKKSAVMLVMIWLLARIAFLIPETLGAVLTALADITLTFWLFLFTISRLNHLMFKRHYDIAGGLLLLLISVIGYHYESITGTTSMRFIRLTTGVWMLLIVMALTRISMQIVNDTLEKNTSDLKYIAKPPRKQLALITILLFSTAEFLNTPSAFIGWLGLAVAASIFNLLNDWHIGKDAFGKWSIILYTIFVSLGVGYGLIGLTKLMNWPITIESAGRHIMLISGLSVAVFMVFAIAGRFHSGRALDERRWVPIGIVLLFGATISRFLLVSQYAYIFFMLAAFLWILAFSLSLYYLLPVFISKRPDGKTDAS